MEVTGPSTKYPNCGSCLNVYLFLEYLFDFVRKCPQKIVHRKLVYIKISLKWKDDEELAIYNEITDVNINGQCSVCSRHFYLFHQKKKKKSQVFTKIGKFVFFEELRCVALYVSRVSVHFVLLRPTAAADRYISMTDFSSYCAYAIGKKGVGGACECCAEYCIQRPQVLYEVHLPLHTAHEGTEPFPDLHFILNEPDNMWCFRCHKIFRFIFSFHPNTES